MSATDERVDNWIEAYLGEQEPHEAPNHWDRLPRDVRERILLLERHRLARHLAYRYGLALRYVQNRALRNYHELDFKRYLSHMTQWENLAKGSVNRKGARMAMHIAVREQLLAVSFVVPWLAEASARDWVPALRNHDDDVYGFYTHLSWLRWKDRDAWSKCEQRRKRRCGVGIDLQAYRERKIRFEGYDLACSRSALREANITLVDRGSL